MVAPIDRQHSHYGKWVTLRESTIGLDVRSETSMNVKPTLITFKSYEIKVFYLSITGGTVYITRGVRYGTVRGYVLWVWVRYVGTCFWVRYGMGTVRGYGTWVRSWVRRTGTVYPPYLFSGHVVLFPKCGLIAAHFGNSTTFPQNRYGGYTVPVRRTYGTYPRTVPVPYPHRTRIVPIPSVRTHGTYPPYAPVPMPKSYPVLGSPGTR